jgi:tetratricopeptide (TPR) repeat protein
MADDQRLHFKVQTVSENSILKTSNEKEVAEIVRQAAEGEISLQQFLALNDDDIEQMAMLAGALYEEDRLEDALVIIEGLIALREGEAAYHNAAGAIYFRQEKYTEALTALDHAIELDPNHMDAYVNRGEIYMVLTSYQEAAADFEKAISMDPLEQNPSAHRARQLVWGMYQIFKECEKEGFPDPEGEVEIES